MCSGRINVYIFIYIGNSLNHKENLLDNYANTSSDSLCLRTTMKSYSVVSA